MAHSLMWLPAVLEAAGLKVALVDGWKDRSLRDFGQPFGVMCHHTVGPKNGNMPSLRTLIEGRSNLPGPLSQLGLGRDGTYYVIAAGRCNHAGTGSWRGLTGGNTNFIGIEAENTGLPNDSPWPDVQMDAYRRGVAAILTTIGRTMDFCVGHKEFALPPGRKPDPSFDMNAFRQSVAAIMNGTAPAPILIPAAEPPTQAGAPAGRPTLRRGMTGVWVKKLQEMAGIAVTDGIFGARTEAAVRILQRDRGLVPDGIVGPKTWAVLGAA